MTNYIPKTHKIFIAGHRGMVGSAILHKLQTAGYAHLVTRSHAELDLSNQAAVWDFVKKEKFDSIIDAAAKVGGIAANNDYRAEFLYKNMAIQNNLMWAAHAHDVKSFIFLGSSCIYPRECPQPIREEYLLTGPLEETNRAYAIAKISGLELIDALNRQFGRSYLSIMPCNLYGPNDNYTGQNSHVIPALIKKFMAAEEAKAAELVIWGSGNPLREFLHSHDLGEAVLKICSLSTGEIAQLFFKFPGSRSFLNVGSQREVSIRGLAETLSKIFNFKGKLVYDHSKPDGTMRKIMDSQKFMQCGWQAKIPLEDGLRQVIKELRSAVG